MKDNRELVRQSGGERSDLERPFESSPSQVPGYGYRDNWENETSQLAEYWRAIRKRLWLVVGITVLLTTLTAIYMARKPNVYQARAAVQVDLEQVNPDLLTSDRRVAYGNNDPAYFNTQLQLLTSDNLLRRAVKEAGLDSNKEFLAAKAEESSSTIGRILRGLGLAGDKKRAGQDSESGDSVKSSAATSEEIAEAIRLAPFVEALRRNLSVEPVRESRATVKDTRLIEVTYISSSPDLSAIVVNGIAETFTKQNQEKRTGSNKKTNDFLQERVTTLQSDIKTDELQLAELKKNSGIINLDAEQTLVINTLAGLNKQLLEAENFRKNAEAQYNAVKDEPAKIRSLAEAENIRYITERETAITTLRNNVDQQVTQLKAEKEKLLTEFQPGAIEIVEIDKKIGALNRGLQEAIDRNSKELKEFRDRTTETILSNLRTRFLQAKEQEDKVRVAFNKQYDAAQGQNGDAINIRLLEQKIATNKGFLENLTKQQSENDVVAQGSENNISIAEIGIPQETPVGPRRLMSVIAALFVSLFFGAGLSLVLEYLDDTIKTPEEAEKFLRLPALAAIPSMESLPSKKRLLLVGSGAAPTDVDDGSGLLIHVDSKSSLAEAYRQLRTSILLSSAGHAPKSLLITSSLPSEGKTTTAVNTAISLAQTGARVLIIDADMRRPRLHSVLNTSNKGGLSTALSSELDGEMLLGLIQKSEAMNLYLLPSGPVPPNPAELIGSQEMRILLDFVQERFTHVVIDSPPIASFTDGVLLASMVDGVILVVHAGKGSRQVVRRGKQYLQTVGAKILGVVLNNVNIKSQSDHYYYQSYYQGEYNAPSEDDRDTL